MHIPARRVVQQEEPKDATHLGLRRGLGHEQDPKLLVSPLFLFNHGEYPLMSQVPPC